MKNIIKIIIFVFILIFLQTKANSKVNDKNNFNHRYLSSYFSALILQNTQEYERALKYFKSSKDISKRHENFLLQYIKSLVLNGKTQEAIRFIKNYENTNTYKDSFEINLLLFLENLKKKNYKNGEKYLNKLQEYTNVDNYQLIIYDTLKSYYDVFTEKKISEKFNQDKSQLSLINLTFQNCYLGNDITNVLFDNLLNQDDEYSRYNFFYINYLIENNNFSDALNVSKNFSEINGGMLSIQSKKWLKDKEFNEIKKLFSCKNENDLVSEFLFLISSLYSSQKLYNQSNFYLNLSLFLNKKFFPNYTLLSENYFLNKKFDSVKKVLNKLDVSAEIYHWHKIKRTAELLEKNFTREEKFIFLEKKIENLKDPPIKVYYDLANLFKREEQYNNAIKYYSFTLEKVSSEKDIRADLLFRRGGCFERLKKFKESDEDLLESLKLQPDNPYVMNYLAYGWLERNFKISEAMKMLQSAYQMKKNDPYIIDSIGWAYYLLGDFETAEAYMNKAIQILPYDPIVNDHYGDILWNLNEKLKARYFWKKTLELEDTDDDMRKKLLQKIIKGVKKI